MRCAIESRRKALAMAAAASDKKGHRIVSVDMRKMSSVCDYFVITSGTSTRLQSGRLMLHVIGSRLPVTIGAL